MLAELKQEVRWNAWKAHRFGVARGLFKPYVRSGMRRVLILSQPSRVAGSQVYPFFLRRRELRAGFGVEIREADLERFMRGGARGAQRADLVLFQAPIHIPFEELRATAQTIRERLDPQRLVYLDWFAPTDLRHAAPLADVVDLYVKKHLLADRSQYGRPTRGDTNLMDHYLRRFDLPGDEVTWPIPDGFLERQLILGPTFSTGPQLLHAFEGQRPKARARTVDVQARLGTRGTPWYEAMRAEAQTAIESLKGLEVRTGGGLAYRDYLRELASSRLCFSPFGYGEVAWRDFEAFMCGSLLIKPDCSHLELEPNVFVAGETYLPVRWDLSDLESTVRSALADPDLQTRLTVEAFERVRRYVREGGFLRQMVPLFT